MRACVCVLADESAAANESYLSALPASVQYAAGRALEETTDGGRPPRILWLGQPRLVPHAGWALALWLLAAVTNLALLTSRPGLPLPLPSEAQPLALVLALLPPLTMLAALLALRRTRGIVYVLTEAGAVALDLTSCVASPRQARHTDYTQMLAESRLAPRTLSYALTCGAMPSMDLIFATPVSLARTPPKARRGSATVMPAPHYGRGPARFSAVARGQVASLRSTLKRQVAAASALAGAAGAAGGEMELRGYSGFHPTDSRGEWAGSRPGSPHQPAIEAIAVTSAQAELVPEISGVVVTDLDAIPRVPVEALSISAAEYADTPADGGGGQLTERSERSSTSARAGRAFSPRPAGAPAQAGGVVV